VRRQHARQPPQRLRIGIGATGYDPETVTAVASRPIVLTVGKGEGCAAGFNLPELDVHKDNSKADVTFSLGRVDPGRYTYTCDMGMVSGTLVVRLKIARETLTVMRATIKALINGSSKKKKRNNKEVTTANKRFEVGRRRR
jgi:plastocyanin domain-containing protein